MGLMVAGPAGTTGFFCSTNDPHLVNGISIPENVI